LADWLATPFPLHPRDAIAGDALPPAALWSAKARALLDFAEGPQTVRLLSDMAEAEEIAAALDTLATRAGDLPRIDLPDPVPWQEGLRALPCDSLAALRDQLDPGVMRALGYDPI
ncbi:hypothetical protein, partial [Roseobacter sp. HKCCA0434]|uniref:hypothetical protein n=1 Tax=Roseobacter sp. HKCCA0434 TaxID=3079297 RepID=UPI002905EC61